MLFELVIRCSCDNLLPKALFLGGCLRWDILVTRISCVSPKKIDLQYQKLMQYKKRMIYEKKKKKASYIPIHRNQSLNIHVVQIDHFPYCPFFLRSNSPSLIFHVSSQVIYQAHKCQQDCPRLVFSLAHVQCLNLTNVISQARSSCPWKISSEDMPDSLSEFDLCKCQ